MLDAKPDPQVSPAAAAIDGAGCHAGAAEMTKAAHAAGKSKTLDQYAADYPKGLHDQPQSMCPADPVVIGGLLAPLGLGAGPAVPTREWRELYQAIDCAVAAAIHPF